MLRDHRLFLAILNVHREKQNSWNNLYAVKTQELKFPLKNSKTKKCELINKFIFSLFIKSVIFEINFKNIFRICGVFKIFAQYLIRTYLTLYIRRPKSGGRLVQGGFRILRLLPHTDDWVGLN